MLNVIWLVVMPKEGRTYEIEREKYGIKLVNVHGHVLQLMDIRPASIIKKTILLCHGLGGRTAQFFRVLDRLDLSETRVIGLNNIGCGESPLSENEDDYSVDKWFELNRTLIRNIIGVENTILDVTSLSPKLHVYHKLIILGHSFGSFIALRLAHSLLKDNMAHIHLGGLIQIGFSPKKPRVPPLVLSLPIWIMRPLLSFTRKQAVSNGLSEKCIKDGERLISTFPPGSEPLSSKKDKDRWCSGENTWNYEESAVAQNDPLLLRSTGRSILKEDSGWDYDNCVRMAMEIHSSGCLAPHLNQYNASSRVSSSRSYHALAARSSFVSGTSKKSFAFVNSNTDDSNEDHNQIKSRISTVDNSSPYPPVAEDYETCDVRFSSSYEEIMHEVDGGGGPKPRRSVTSTTTTSILPPPERNVARWVFINGEFDEGMPPKTINRFRKNERLRDVLTVEIPSAKHNPQCDFPAEVAEQCQGVLNAVASFQTLMECENHVD